MSPSIPRALSPRDITRSGLCIGCGSCVAQTDANARGANARMEFDAFGNYQPAGDVIWLHQPTETFARTCPFSPAAANENQLARELFADAPHRDQHSGNFAAAYVGYVSEADFRDNGSSGGMVSWVANELLKRGLVDGVAHVVPVENPQRDGQFFRYRIARSEREIGEGAKSRYYPVEMSEILREIRATPGRYAVVGVPCFIKALQLLRREDEVVRERVAFTLGLFCGHMKSARFVESLAWQMGVAIDQVQRVEFRLKDTTRAASVYTGQLTLRDGEIIKKDWWEFGRWRLGRRFFPEQRLQFLRRCRGRNRRRFVWRRVGRAVFVRRGAATTSSSPARRLSPI